MLIVGLGARLVFGGTGAGDRSALVMATLLTLGAWLAARLIGGPRTAFLVSLGLLVLFDVAALPPRGVTEFDGVEAWYRTDQVVAAQLARPTTAAANLTLLVQPMFGGTQPTFGLGAEAIGVSRKWTCPCTRDIERLALPVPPQALGNASSLDIHVHLTGSPTRDSDYLLVYTSSRLGGPVISLQGSPAPEAPLTMCALASA